MVTKPGSGDPPAGTPQRCQNVLSFIGSLKTYVAVESCDMRKGFEGLLALTSGVLQQDIRSGGLYVTNRKRNRIKVLYFDGTGFG